MTWQEAVMGACGMAFALGITVVIVVQAAATWRARMVLTRDEAHQRLVEEATRTQRETAQKLDRVLEELAVVREKTAAMERALAEVGEPWESRSMG